MQKYGRKGYIYICTLLMAAFFISSVVPYYIYGKGAYRIGVNLSPVSRVNPLFYDDLDDELMLGAFLRTKVEADPGILFTDDVSQNKRTNLGTKIIKVPFERSEPFEVKSSSESSNSLKNIVIVPCEISDDRRKTFKYAFVFLYGDDRVEISLRTEKEKDVYIQNLRKAGGISEKEAQRLISELSPKNFPSLWFSELSDKSVRDVMSFLKAAGMKKLNDRFQELIASNGLFFKEKSDIALVQGAIKIDDQKDQTKIAEAILSSILARKNVPKISISKFLAAFSDFRKKKQDYSIDEDNPELIPYVLDIEQSPNIALNEGYMKFPDSAYGRIVAPVVKMKDYDKLREQVVYDFVDVFNKVAEHEMKHHNELVPEGKRIVFSRMPGITLKDKETGIDIYRFRTKHLSENILPSVIADDKGVIWLNYNFMILLMRLYELGLHTSLGDITTSNRKEPIGNLYESIMYAIAFHEIRGHFHFTEEGNIIFNPDEKWAQAERGRSMEYNNMLAIGFLWTVPIMGETRYFPDVIDELIEEYPELVRNLTREEKKRFSTDLAKFGLVLQKKGFFTSEKLSHADKVETTGTKEEMEEIVKRTVYGRMLPSIEGKDGTLFVQPSNVFKVLLSSNEPMTKGEILKNKALEGADAGRVSWALSVLEELGVVNARRKDLSTGEFLPGPLYEAVPLSGEDVRRVYEALYANDTSEEKNGLIDIDLKGQLMQLTEELRPLEFMNAIADKLGEEKAREKTEKLTIALEMDWVPEGQRDFARMAIQALLKLRGKGAIDIIWRSPEDKARDISLADKIRSGVSGESYKNVVVLASKDNIDELSEFKDAFVVGVDPAKLERRDNCYIRFFEMLEMAVRMARGQNQISEHPGIKLQQIDQRTFIFIPRAEPLNLDDLREIYKQQIEALLAA